MKKLLTIFILTYERPEFLKECLLSLNKQTFQCFEVIIIDNSQIAKNESMLDVNYKFEILYKKNKKNLGAEASGSMAYNWKINTQYFMIFHDDDLMHPDYIKISMNYLIKNQNLSWIGCNYSSNKRYLKDKYKVSFKTFNQSELIYEIFKGLNFTLSSVIYNKKNLFNLNFLKYVDKYSIISDRPFLIDLIKPQKKIAIINQRLIYYRLHEIQESKSTKTQISVDNQLNFFLFYKNKYKKNLKNYLLFNFFLSNNLISSFKNLNNTEDLSTINFLKISKNKKLIDNYFLIFYLTTRILMVIYNFKKKIFNSKKKII